MTIETKYNSGQMCWVLHDNKVQEMQVVGIFISLRYGCKNEITYSLHNSSSMYFEGDVFESKEALIQSL
jgi:hypothetical protein